MCYFDNEPSDNVYCFIGRCSWGKNCRFMHESPSRPDSGPPHHHPLPPRGPRDDYPLDPYMHRHGPPMPHEFEFMHPGLCVRGREGRGKDWGGREGEGRIGEGGN